MKTSQFFYPYFVKINFFLPNLLFFSLFDLETLEHYLKDLLLDLNLFYWCTNKGFTLRNLLTLKVYHVFFSFIPIDGLVCYLLRGSTNLQLDKHNYNKYSTSALEVFSGWKLAVNELLEYSSNVKLSLVIIPWSFLSQAIKAAVALKKCWLFRAFFALSFRFIATLVKTGLR